LTFNSEVLLDSRVMPYYEELAGCPAVRPWNETLTQGPGMSIL